MRNVNSQFELAIWINATNKMFPLLYRRVASYARIYLLGGRRIGVFKIYQSRKRLFLCLLLQYDARDHKNHFIRVLCTRRSTSLDMRACVACLSCGYASKRNFPNVSFDKPQKFEPSSLSWQWCDVFFLPHSAYVICICACKCWLYMYTYTLNCLPFSYIR